MHLVSRHLSTCNDTNFIYMAVIAPPVNSKSYIMIFHYYFEIQQMRVSFVGPISVVLFGVDDKLFLSQWFEKGCAIIRACAFFRINKVHVCIKHFVKRQWCLSPYFSMEMLNLCFVATLYIMDELFANEGRLVDPVLFYRTHQISIELNDRVILEATKAV